MHGVKNSKETFSPSGVGRNREVISTHIFTPMDYTNILSKTRPVVLEAASFIRSKAKTFSESDIEIKSRNSLVTFVDKTAEEMLVKGLSEVLPEAGFITEEGTTAQKKSTYTWIIDPLDGTTNFLQHIPFYAVSVGLLHEDELVVGIVFDVEQEEEFYAWKGGGAWCNGERIFTSGKTQIEDAMVATGFPYAEKDVVPELIQTFEYFLKKGRGLRRLGSAALDLAYVACGRFDIYYESNLNAWDIAGGILIVEEAGGKVTDFQGGRTMLDSGSLISTNSHVHEKAISILRDIYHP